MSEAIIREMLKGIGEDPDRPGLVDTPKRVVKMWSEVFKGYDPEKFPKVTMIKNGDDGIKYTDMIIDSGYFFSHCEHHMVPFFGTYSFGYIPYDWLVGASKIYRVIDYYASRLQIAERLVHDVADYFDKQLAPQGLILIMRGRHLCKEMRGIKQFNSPFEVIAVRGCFLENRHGCKDEFLSRCQIQGVER